MGDEYTAEYLHLTSTFIYFSHKRVSIPPAPWINTCHRSGVRVLGTFLVENSEASREAGRLFERGSEGEFLFASQLALIAKTYGFDGWLLNMESSLPPEKWSANEMQRFIDELRAGLGDGGGVVWYDALTILNQVHYQNGLTLLNAPFLSAAGEFFANYGWRARELASTTAMAAAMGLEDGVFMGIDCYGRGSLGGGGFGVGIALEEIRKAGLQAALFAPGWTWEHYEGKNFRNVEKKFWGVVAQTVEPKPAGDKDGFYTSFNRGFGSGLWVQGKKVTAANWVHLGAQSLLPHFPSEGNWTLDTTCAYLGAWSLKLSSRPGAFIPLYRLGVNWAPDLVLEYTFQGSASANPSQATGIYWELLHPSGRKTRHTELFISESTSWQTSSVLLDDEDSTLNSLVTELGFFGGGSINLGSLRLSKLNEAPQPTITPVVAHEDAQKLSWSVYPSYPTSEAASSSTWSEQTKGLQYFLVWNGEVLRGVAFACEFLLDAAEPVGGGWRVDGITWGGEVVRGPEQPVDTVADGVGRLQLVADA